ncbi:MAG: hypothetical protein U1E77_07060 [Inhella sp.]
MATLGAGAGRALQCVGTYAAGALGQRFPKRYILSFIYAARSVAAIVAFITLPISPASVYVFSAVMGLLRLPSPAHQCHGGGDLAWPTFRCWWCVLLRHQIGSFLGVWLGAGQASRWAVPRDRLVDRRGAGRVRRARQLRSRAGAAAPTRGGLMLRKLMFGLLALLVLVAVLLAWIDPALMQALAEGVRGCF